VKTLKYILSAALALTMTVAATAKIVRAPQEKGTHRVLTCNIRITGLSEDENTPGQWENRKEVCRDVILSQKPDIICMQEVIYESYAYMKKELKGYTSFGFTGPEMDPYTEGYHFIGKNVIFFRTSRYEMTGSGCYWLSEDPLIGGSLSWNTTRARHCNWLRLRDKKTGEEFRIMDIHLDHKTELARQEQTKLTIRETSQYAEDFPQILCGDFNSGPKKAAAGFLREAGWKDAYETLGIPERNSFHGFKGENYKKPKPRIDFIFMRGAVQPVYCKMLTDTVNGILPSDHYFIVADLKIGNND
jgi:endonuclease/exonuclease/phosphatase family metal-dependent hydrolase